jgi:ABC-2 type transport system permease protein
MNFLRLIVAKEFAHIRADEMTIRLMIAPVFVLMFILGYAITTEVKNVTITAVDHSNTPASRDLIQTVQHNRFFVFKGYASSESEARLMLDRGDARLALLIPADFAKNLGNGTGADIGLLVDGQDANSSNVSSGYIQSIISLWSRGMLKVRLAAAGVNLRTVLPIDVRPEIFFNPMLKSSWYMIPALAVVLVTMITALLTGFSIVREKMSGTLEQLMVTPISPVHVVMGKVIPYAIIGLVELSAVLVLATLWFRVPFHGNFGVLLLFGAVYMMSSLGVGILVSTIARTPQQVLFMLWFLLIFLLFLSGLFLPLEQMPAWVQKVTYINPLRYFMFVLRAMFLKGSGLAELWPQGAAMLAIGGVVFGAALLAFQRKVT